MKRFNKKPFLSRGAAVLFLCALIPMFLAAPAAAGSQPEVAEEIISPTVISWRPLLSDYQSMVLKVAGPEDLYLREEFPRGSWPELLLSFEDGAPLPDGSYRYEIMVVPTLAPHVRAELVRSRETGDRTIVEDLQNSGALPSESMIQSGHFRIRDGVAVLPAFE
ncbi:hypothetical protein N9903_00145 [bacterium]|nr:hypothetical protein [bacterium]